MITMKSLCRLTQEYEQWLENVFKDLKNRGINATLESDGSIVCEKNGETQITTKVAAYSKYREYLIKYPD